MNSDDDQKKDFKPKNKSSTTEKKDFSFSTEKTPPDETGRKNGRLSMTWSEGVIDRVVGSRKIKFKRPTFNFATEKLKIRDVVEVLVYATLVALVVRAFLMESFRIPSMSMGPTLMDGDFIFVSKLSYGVHIPFTKSIFWEALPSYGDIIVFRHKDREEFHIKRVIGLPGDKVRVDRGRVTLNDRPLEVDAPDLQKWEKMGLVTYNEILPHGKKHSILIPVAGDIASSDPVVVPENNFFVLGDHRATSEDSRHYGTIPKEWVLGKGKFVWLSIQKDPHYKLRLDHMGSID